MLKKSNKCSKMVKNGKSRRMLYTSKKILKYGEKAKKRVSGKMMKNIQKVLIWLKNVANSKKDEKFKLKKMFITNGVASP